MCLQPSFERRVLSHVSYPSRQCYYNIRCSGSVGKSQAMVGSSACATLSRLCYLGRVLVRVLLAAATACRRVAHLECIGMFAMMTIAPDVLLLRAPEADDHETASIPHCPNIGTFDRAANSSRLESVFIKLERNAPKPTDSSWRNVFFAWKWIAHSGAASAACI